MTLLVETDAIRFSIPPGFIDHTSYVLDGDGAELTFHTRYVPANKPLEPIVDARRDRILTAVGDQMPDAAIDHTSGDAALVAVGARYTVVAYGWDGERSRIALVVARVNGEDGVEIGWRRSLPEGVPVSADPAEILAILASVRWLTTAPASLPAGYRWRWLGRLGLAAPATLNDPRDFTFEQVNEGIDLDVVLDDGNRPLQECLLWGRRFGRDEPWVVREIAQGALTGAHSGSERVLSIERPSGLAPATHLVREAWFSSASRGARCRVLGAASPAQSALLESTIRAVVESLTLVE